MERRGSAILPLHYGHPPEYLYKRMVKLGGTISDLIVEKFGIEKLLENLSDPFLFHSLSLAIGFDWNSSGTTTATLSALKEYYSGNRGEVFILGGKGKHLGQMETEFQTLVRDGAISDSLAAKIRKDARKVARVDQNLLQDGFDLYMQFLVLNSTGKWVVVQQGMNQNERMARRYHWIHKTGLDFINDGRNGISSVTEQSAVLDLSTSSSERNRNGMINIIRDNPNRYASRLQYGSQRTLDNFTGENQVLRMDYRIDWNRMRELYEYQPDDFQELAFMKGVGKSTIRALSYLAEIIYGTPPSFVDPVKFSFAVGGKDGMPKPVNVYDYDKVISFYREILRDHGIGNYDLEDLAKKMARMSMERTS